jgi:hypothetical protein
MELEIRAGRCLKFLEDTLVQRFDTGASSYVDLSIVAFRQRGQQTFGEGGEGSLHFSGWPTESSPKITAED